jgi:hypothetical protein
MSNARGIDIVVGDRVSRHLRAVTEAAVVSAAWDDVGAWSEIVFNGIGQSYTVIAWAN